MADTQPLFDITKIRADARNSILEGAVTPDYPLDLEATYRLMNQALASEIICVLRYRHHQIIAKGIDWPQVAAQFEEHAREEEKHMLLIAERISQLGGDPNFDPTTAGERAFSDYGSSGPNVSLDQLIKEDLVAERVVIEIYRHFHHPLWHGWTPPAVAYSRSSWQMRKSTPTTWPICWPQ